MNPQLKPIIGIGEGNIDILIKFFDTDNHNIGLSTSFNYGLEKSATIIILNCAQCLHDIDCKRRILTFFIRKMLFF